MTMKVIQRNRPAGTDSVCRDEAGNEYHASSKEHCGEEKKGGALQRWTEAASRAKLPLSFPLLLFTLHLS
ncbi:hypothetical protein ABVT39_016072 [Epinephelus coioides]